jgi:hypothetical protein
LTVAILRRTVAILCRTVAAAMVMTTRLIYPDIPTAIATNRLSCATAAGIVGISITSTTCLPKIKTRIVITHIWYIVPSCVFEANLILQYMHTGNLMLFG